MVNKTTFKQYLLEAEGKMTPAESQKDLFGNIVDGKFNKDGSKLEVHNFICKNTPLVSLEGAPQLVANYFNCIHNLELTSLKGGPKKVGGDFNCSNNPELTSLEGAPQTIDGNFECKYNPKLTSLIGAPQKVDNIFDCSINNLHSLEGCPQTTGTFSCSTNPELTSLEGAPQLIKGTFYCKANLKIRSLARINFYIHEINGDRADFTGCPIKSNVLGLLKIRNLKKVEFDDEKLQEIMNRHLPIGDSTDCIDDLLDAGYGKEYCKW